MDEMQSLVQLYSLRDKTAVITGAAAGMGLATARRFAEAGANLLLLDVNAELLQTLPEKIRLRHGWMKTVEIDLAQKEEIDAFWHSLRDTEYPDVLINNAGIFPFRDFLETDQEFVQQVMDVNLNAAYWLCQHFVRQRLAVKKSGSIVNVGSIEAQLPFKEDLAHYTTGKAAVIALTRALARDYGRFNIRANVILPGGILTEGVKSASKQVLKDPKLIKDGFYFKSRLPLGRFGDPDEVARVTLMLATDICSYMNGAVIPIDGGFLSA